MIETDIVQGDVRYVPADHRYIHVPTNKRLTSVSEVIRTVYSKKSWDGVDPAIVENARIRGEKIDSYMTTYVREKSVTIEGENEDVRNRVVIAHRIWEEQFSGLPAESQVIVHSLQDGVAGRMDFFVDRRIVADLKSTYYAEPDWVLQIGGYCTYAPNPVERAGIIHVSPKTYKNGGRWIEYDVEVCKRYWRSAVEWWQRTKLMEKFSKSHVA